MTTLVPVPGGAPRERKPAWLKVKLPSGEQFRQTKDLLRRGGLVTVCEEAQCPNIAECFGTHGTATFMILGEVCTRSCRYCAVASGRPPLPPDPAEPRQVAEAAERMGLRHVVVTSVDRDDLKAHRGWDVVESGELGSAHWAATIAALREWGPAAATVEVLIPDFRGFEAPLVTVLEARPDVLNHNLETVRANYKRARPGGRYEWALTLLARAKAWSRVNAPEMRTKSGIMVGLGETTEQLLEAMQDLRDHDVDILTLGQYLQPSPTHLPVDRYVTPAEFNELRRAGRAMGFEHVFAGPLVRSSYHAGEQLLAAQHAD